MKSTIKLSALLLLASTALASMNAYADDADTEALLRKNGCFKCHAVDKTKKGPAYKKVADHRLTHREAETAKAHRG